MTAQEKDKLTFNDEVYYLATEPLKSYLQKHNIKFETWWTACWRGYTGNWIIEDNKLYLVELHSFEIPHRNALDDIFPGQQKVFAEWFSGTIHTFSDKMYMYLEFKIENGCLVNVEKKESEYMKILDEQLIGE